MSMSYKYLQERTQTRDYRVLESTHCAIVLQEASLTLFVCEREEL